MKYKAKLAGQYKSQSKWSIVREEDIIKGRRHGNMGIWRFGVLVCGMLKLYEGYGRRTGGEEIKLRLRGCGKPRDVTSLDNARVQIEVSLSLCLMGSVRLGDRQRTGATYWDKAISMLGNQSLGNRLCKLPTRPSKSCRIARETKPCENISKFEKQVSK